MPGLIPAGRECTPPRGRQHPALPGRGGEGKPCSPCSTAQWQPRAIALLLPLGSGASPAAGSQADNRLVEN